MAASAGAAFMAHCERWNAHDRDGWLALFRDDVTFDDPVGVPTKHGRLAAETSFDRSNASWRLEPRRVVDRGAEAAVDLVNVGIVNDAEVIVESIEIWRVDADGRVAAVRSYFTPDAAVNDPYYVPGG